MRGIFGRGRMNTNSEVLSNEGEDVNVSRL